MWEDLRHAEIHRVHGEGTQNMLLFTTAISTLYIGFGLSGTKFVTQAGLDASPEEGGGHGYPPEPQQAYGWDACKSAGLGLHCS